MNDEIPFYGISMVILDLLRYICEKAAVFGTPGEAITFKLNTTNTPWLFGHPSPTLNLASFIRAVLMTETRCLCGASVK
jgi:hypothetical protein